MDRNQVILGIDIGGTNTSSGLVDEIGNIFLVGSIATEAQESFESFLERFNQDFDDRLKSSGQEFEIVAIGIGAPNANYYSGMIENPPNLSWGKVNLVEAFKRLYELPVVITNDANAAALGEQKFGAAQGLSDFIEITLGTGLGSGLIVDGKLVLGSDGHAGELGHITVIPGGRLCTCGRRGCLETYVSANGIKRTVVEMSEQGDTNSVLTNVPNDELSAEIITSAAEQGDMLSQNAFHQTADILGLALANIVAYLSPQVIILFGGLAQAGDLLFKPLRSSFEKNLLRNYVGKVAIKPSGLKPGEAAILGAAALAWKETS